MPTLDSRTGHEADDEFGDPTDAEFDTLFARMQQAVREREAWLWIRQSSHAQKVKHKGSAAVQRQQARYVAPLGLTSESIRVVDARGESGSVDADRPRFRDMLAAAQAGRIGILLLARHDRLARSDAESAAMHDALARHRSLIMVDGRCYDPAMPEDALMLRLLATFAEYENRARTRWMQLARWALVCRQRYRVRLPSGLVWASPDDPAYVEQMERAGLGAWVERAVADPALYQARSAWVERLGPRAEAGPGTEADDAPSDDPAHEDAPPGDAPDERHPDGRWLLPLPFPDAEVVRAVELRLAWLLETGSVTVVLKRIRTHPDWPRPGMVPVAPGRLWRPGEGVRWRPARRIMLRQWYRSPALFGIYTAQSTLNRPGSERPGRGDAA
jgi:DNA invertase Pin-like site-specific DNA recombinase